MDGSEQAAGERRVRRVLIEPLHRRGLMRPAGQTRDQFEAMQQDICARLAYMTETGLAALEEQCAANAGGKGRDRFPIGPSVLKWAADIEPPSDSASPLLRAVFRHQIGRDALDQGYAPELLAMVRRDRRWPGPYAIKMVREAADPAIRSLTRIEEALARGHDVCEADVSFRARRLMALRKCRDIAGAAGQDGGA